MQPIGRAVKLVIAIIAALATAGVGLARLDRFAWLSENETLVVWLIGTAAALTIALAIIEYYQWRYRRRWSGVRRRMEASLGALVWRVWDRSGRGDAQLEWDKIGAHLYLVPRFWQMWRV